MSRFPSEKVMATGAGLVGLYLLWKAMVKDEEIPMGEGYPGAAEDLLEEQGFHVAPTAPADTADARKAYQIPIISPDLPTPSPTPSPMRDAGDTLPTDFKRLQEEQAEQTLTDVTKEAEFTPPEVTLPEYGLGIVGLTGTYFTSFGQRLLKKPPWESFMEKTRRGGIEAIPIAGKKAAAFVAKPIKSAEGILGRLGKVGVKGAKTGIGLIPFVGTVAGAEFDVRTREKSRILAYPAAIIGDILGGLGAVVAVPSGPVGVVGAGIAGQIAGEEAVYKMAGITAPAVESYKAQVQLISKVSAGTMEVMPTPIKKTGVISVPILGAVTAVPVPSKPVPVATRTITPTAPITGAKKWVSGVGWASPGTTYYPKG